MSGNRSHLAPVPDPRDEDILDWLHEAEAGASRPVLDRAFAALASVRQQRPWPGYRLFDALRPEPFGIPSRQMVVLLTAAALLVAIVAGLIAGGAINPRLLFSVTPSAEVSPAPDGSTAPGPTFPLAGEALEVVFQDGSGRLFVIGADGSGRRSVSADITGELVWPDWVPGTNMVIALEGTFEGTEQIWSIDTAGSRRSQVIIPCVAPCQSRNEAAVSHDGSKIVFFQAWGEPIGGIPPACSLQLYDIASQAISAVTDHECGPLEERHPRFSPDDTKLAFWRTRPPAPVASGESAAEPDESALFVRDLGSGAERRVVDWSTHATHLDWSPDGQWLAFVPDAASDRLGARDVWRVRTDGTDLERLTDLGSTTARLFRPIYTPDGRWILFMDVRHGQGRLRAVPADGGSVIDVLPGVNVLEYDVRGG